MALCGFVLTGVFGPARAEGSSFFADLEADVAHARASQPGWSSPLTTTTGLLENRLRFDVEALHSGNGAETTLLDGGKGLDLIVGPNSEIQIAAAPYAVRTSPGKPGRTGFGDWPFLRLEQRLASSPEAEGNYVITAWLQIQAPTGIKTRTAEAWIFAPTFAFGKGWGDFDIQGTITASLPSTHENRLGHPVQTNIAFQYRVMNVFWPEIETSWIYYPDGLRAGLNQLHMTLGMVLGRFTLAEGLRFTFGGGYQFALAPRFRERPFIPSFDRAWVFSTRLNFQ